MSIEFKHNKKRNSGLLYEFLVRKMSEGLIEKNDKKYNVALNIAQRYFSDGLPLCEERKFYDVLMNNRGLTKEVADRLLNEVKTKFSSLDQKSIEKEKGKLIYEINTRFGQKFYDEYRLNNYREFATVYILMDSWKKNDVKNMPGRAVLEESVSGMMTAKVIKEERDAVSEAANDKLVYSVALKKLDEKYGGTLNKKQKAILKEYVAYSLSGDVDKFATFMDKQRSQLNETISSFNTTDKGKLFCEKFEEVKSKLASYDFRNCDDDIVEEMMLYHTLVEEIESDV